MMSSIDCDDKKMLMCSLMTKHFKKRVVCYEDDIILIFINNTSCFKIKYDPRMTWKHLKSLCNTSLGINPECDICNESSVMGIRLCVECCKTWCRECDYKISTCPFCRTYQHKIY